MTGKKKKEDLDKIISQDLTAKYAQTIVECLRSRSKDLTKGYI